MDGMKKTKLLSDDVVFSMETYRKSTEEREIYLLSSLHKTL